MHFSLHEALGLSLISRPVAFCGSGGKSSIAYGLAWECLQAGLKAAVATSTHVEMPLAPPLALFNTADKAALEALWSKGQLPICGKIAEDRRLSFGGEEQWQLLKNACDSLFLEADGSMRLPIKFPNATEPVLLAGVEKVFVVQGLSGIGKIGEQICHRWQLAKEHFPYLPDTVTPEAAALLLFEGYKQYDPIYILNQADTPKAWEKGKKIAALLFERGAKQVTVLSAAALGCKKEQLFPNNYPQ